MDIRTAEHTDIEAVYGILSDGARFLNANGVDQWTGGYPSREIIAEDIAQGGCYLVFQEGVPAAAFTLLDGPEADYAITYEGEWLKQTENYFVIHRMAVFGDFRGRGLAGLIYEFCFDTARNAGKESVRIDTHRDNKAMQRSILKAGFTPCGYVIYKAEGKERLVFEKLI